MSLSGLSNLAGVRALVAEIEAMEASSDPHEQERRLDLAIELKTLADQHLRDSVTQARIAGLSWQTVGDLLGVSRQAAFQRFREEPHTGKGTHVRTKTQETLVPKAEAVYWHLRTGDYAAVAAGMTFVVERLLSEDKVMGVWSEAVRMIGDLESLGDSFVRPTRRNAVVVETPLRFEAGDLVGRIAFNKRQRIVGMLIMRPEDIATAPF